MTDKIQNFTFLSEEQKQKCIKDIISFFLDEKDEEIGVIAAEQILDFILEKVAKNIYNKGVKDSKKLIQEKLGELNFELDLLKKE